MKVKHIITTCGLLGGLIVTSGAGSAISNVAKSDVQFTFRPVLTLELDDNLSDTDYPNNTFLINDLAPGNVKDSNEVTATVTTNSAAGYTLSATVGDTTSAALNTTDLVLGSGGDKFEMTTDNVATLSTGKWGYRVKNGTYGNYSALDISTSKILNATRDNIGTASTASYPGGATTDMKIGAYAKTSQVAGKYQNVINFEAVANVAAHQVNLLKGAMGSAATHVATVEINSVNGTAITPVTAGSWSEGTTLGITATCDSGYTFSNWNLNYDYGSLADRALATTTYTVGGGSVNVTAYCGGGS